MLLILDNVVKDNSFLKMSCGRSIMKGMRNTMNREELTKQDIIRCCCAELITEKDAAKRLKKSVRQVQRLKAKLRGGISFLHGNCGRIPKSVLPPEQKQAILAEFNKPEYEGVNFYHFTKLIEKQWFSASYSAISNLLKANGFVSPKRRKNKPKVHKTRERRAKFGELLQVDGSPHDWFGAGEKTCIHVSIDDATGRLTGLHMSQNECLDGYFSIIRQTLEKYGTPEAIYADGLSVFFSNKKQELLLEEQLLGVEERKTQFGSICDHLGIGLIHAHSPQAKGRVERVIQTLQDRLPIELRLRGICDMDNANEFCENEYMDIFNAEFEQATRDGSCFVPIPSTVDLDELLSWKTTRKVDKGCCFSLNRIKFCTSYQLASKTVEVLISKKLGIVIKHDGKFYDVKPLMSSGNISKSDSVDMIVKRFVYHYTLKNEHICM